MRQTKHVALLLLLSACALLGGAAEEPRSLLESGTKRYSQFKEELIIRDFFEDRRGGFFVDVGAWRPRESSTTYYLERHLGWSGIAIDAQTGLAEAWARLRPRSRFFAYIVTDHSGSTETLYLAGPISSVEKSHRDQVHAGRGLPEKLMEQPPEEVEVETITLNDLLDREGVKEIDFLSMDIEQGEPSALAGFDIKRFRPELVCIEAFHTTRERILRYFETNGYERLEKYLPHDPANWYFAPKERHETP